MESKTIEIIGDNYLGEIRRTRTACRGIIVENNKILLSYEKENDQWMIPGGGLEDNETDKGCVIREVQEETGMVIEASDCALIINEYYGNAKYINKYFFGKVVGKTGRHLTDREIEVGMEPRWLDLDETIKIFSTYEAYKDTLPMRFGLYRRELTALKALINK